MITYVISQPKLEQTLPCIAVALYLFAVTVILQEFSFLEIRTSQTNQTKFHQTVLFGLKYILLNLCSVNQIVLFGVKRDKLLFVGIPKEDPL